MATGATNNTTRRYSKNDRLNSARSVPPYSLSLAYHAKIRIPGRSGYLGNGTSGKESIRDSAGDEISVLVRLSDVSSPRRSST